MMTVFDVNVIEFQIHKNKTFSIKKQFQKLSIHFKLKIEQSMLKNEWSLANENCEHAVCLSME